MAVPVGDTGVAQMSKTTAAVGKEEMCVYTERGGESRGQGTEQLDRRPERLSWK